MFANREKKNKISHLFLHGSWCNGWVCPNRITGNQSLAFREVGAFIHVPASVVDGNFDFSSVDSGHEGKNVIIKKNETGQSCCYRWSLWKGKDMVALRQIQIRAPIPWSSTHNTQQRKKDDVLITLIFYSLLCDAIIKCLGHAKYISANLFKEYHFSMAESMIWCWCAPNPDCFEPTRLCKEKTFKNIPFIRPWRRTRDHIYCINM